ncbi:MAG: hypothetical protein KGI40_10585, partial [Xanthomonadaceae bacterium]|nr:hypothetical protein [Xanthomonadaceae bacterium]
GKRKEERGKRKEERGKRKEERGKRKEQAVILNAVKDLSARPRFGSAHPPAGETDPSLRSG